ncbi:MAG: beta-class phenol-soluble modulin [Staphylococcus epidermidis]|nr:beta-class phenol-soluble modulin [Staphylococcus epidermidis]
MEQLFDAIRSVVDAGINQDWSQLASGTVKAAQDQDWTKLGTSIVDIVESGVSVLGKIFGF